MTDCSSSTSWSAQKTSSVSARSSIKQRGRNLWQQHKEAQEFRSRALFVPTACVWRRGKIKCKIRKRRGCTKKSLWKWFTCSFITDAGFWREETVEDKAEPTLCCFPFYEGPLHRAKRYKKKKEIKTRKKNTSRWFRGLTWINKILVSDLVTYQMCLRNFIGNRIEKKKKKLFLKDQQCL